MANTLITAGLATAEKIIAQCLTQDPGSRESIKHFAPQVLQLNIQSPAICIYACFTEQGVELLQHFEGEVTASLTGSLADLIRVFAKDTHNLKDSGVRLEGKASFINELKVLVKQVDIDWEEILCKIFGDFFGPQIAAGIRKQIGWTRDRAKNMSRLTEEFLTHESGSVVSKVELEYFYQQVAQIKLATEQLKARMDKQLQTENPDFQTH